MGTLVNNPGHCRSWKNKFQKEKKKKKNKPAGRTHIANNYIFYVQTIETVFGKSDDIIEFIRRLSKLKK